MSHSPDYVIKLSCENQPGIVAAVASFLAGKGFDILESAQYDDQLENRFFMRVLTRGTNGMNWSILHEGFSEVAEKYSMEWSLRASAERRRVMVLVSKFDHCLVDLVYRQRIDELPIDIVGVICNHPREALPGLELGQIPFHYLPITANTKEAQEAEIVRLIETSGAELVILARYMQILSDQMSAYLSGRCINIHHSFLPGFKGAKPYHQAYSKGVKLIGATAHYVTGQLDEGPIIEQDVERISHMDSPDNLVRKGRDIERRVLARAVRYHLDDRVILNGVKTVVFPD